MRKITTEETIVLAVGCIVTSAGYAIENMRNHENKLRKDRDRRKQQDKCNGWSNKA